MFQSFEDLYLGNQENIQHKNVQHENENKNKNILVGLFPVRIV